MGDLSGNDRRNGRPEIAANGKFRTRFLENIGARGPKRRHTSKEIVLACEFGEALRQKIEQGAKQLRIVVIRRA